MMIWLLVSLGVLGFITGMLASMVGDRGQGIIVDRWDVIQFVGILVIAWILGYLSHREQVS